jgi:(E)-4-hydroxy-3-methylbut-2-enyl-diphosphate synthase
MLTNRNKTKTIKIGNIEIGGSNPIVVQSMTKTFTKDTKNTIDQIKKLEKAECKIVRCAVRDEEDAVALKKIKKAINISLIADIHFDYRLALLAIKQNIDKLRINPANIGSKDKVKEIVLAAKAEGIPIRIGINAGSFKKRAPSVKNVVDIALDHISFFEDLHFFDIVISLKSSSIPFTIQAYKIISKKNRYPLHIGITEAGIPEFGTVRSAVGIGSLLAEGIGDTIRVSLTADPVEEIKVAYQILEALELEKRGITIISCPTCGRCNMNIAKIVKVVYQKVKHIKGPIKIAIMGCEVNGPGEAREADIGLACGRNIGLIFREGNIIKKVNKKNMVKSLIEEVTSYQKTRNLP